MECIDQHFTADAFSIHDPILVEFEDILITAVMHNL